ncbi:ImmA/IrrE family metallo-endopeptidase [Streptococcus uberis]|uniref:ImmA/IrrE family metallo-endopeptidase n=1 Tax=Streptococcus uberis TaxID=1349 RepID=UPI000DFD0F36|nr:ImmA/IrrE family metallo-endopeptidase [Streptococcus uberis]SUO92669.1 phage protein [Streptococcus uberis]
MNVLYFDGRETDSKGYYNKPTDTIILDAYLDEIEKQKVTYHEYGHKDHTKEYYKLNKEKAELQADHSMIHHLLKEYLTTLDDISDFNVYRFMDLYRLKTFANEAMVIEEYNNLI